MSKDESTADKTLSHDENGLQPASRPKSGSLSSEDGDGLNPKQSRFFKNLSRSLDPAVAPPKKDFLDGYQKYKAKQAFKLHGVVKQQTIDLGTLESSKTSDSRRFSTGTNPPLSLQTDAKAATLPVSHGTKGPPPPVAPRKKSVNLPLINEPSGSAHSHPHETPSYILSAAKKEQQKADPSFQKFRSLTGPTVFRPARNGPTAATRKITPVGLTSANSEKEEATVKSTAGIPGENDESKIDEKVAEVESPQVNASTNVIDEESHEELLVENKDSTATEANEGTAPQKTMDDKSSVATENESKDVLQNEVVHAPEQKESEETQSVQEDKEITISPNEDVVSREVVVEGDSSGGNTEVQEKTVESPTAPEKEQSKEDVNMQAEVTVTDVHNECTEDKTELPKATEEVSETKEGIPGTENIILDQVSSCDKHEEVSQKEDKQNSSDSVIDHGNEDVIEENEGNAVNQICDNDKKEEDTSMNTGNDSVVVQQNQGPNVVENGTNAVTVVSEKNEESQSVVPETQTDQHDDSKEPSSKDSTEKLSKMADLLISFSEDKKEKLDVKDGDLGDVGKELQELNSSIQEISGISKPEKKPEDQEKLEDLEMMRKEMEEMVTEFDTYL